MSSHSMIHQLLNDAKGKIDQVILNTTGLDELNASLEQAKLPALIIDNTLPLGDGIHRETIDALRNKGIEYYPAGRTGMPAMVTAEDGLAVPGNILATNDENCLELSVLGTYVLYLDPKGLSALLSTSTTDLSVPETTQLVLRGKPGEWTGGTDIALYLVKYYNLPKNTLIEISGEGLNSLPLNERFNLARTLIGLGYKQLLFQVDEAVMAFLQDRTEGEGRFYFAEEKPAEKDVVRLDLEKIHPMIAWNEKGNLEIGPLTDQDGTDIDLVFIGGDTACRYADVEAGLKLIRYRPIADTVSAAILPGSQLVNGDLLDMGVAGILTEIGFELLPSSFLHLLKDHKDTQRTRLGTSTDILNAGGMTASALSCFTAAMTGRITHPLELESILKQQEEQEHDHEHDHDHE